MKEMNIIIKNLLKFQKLFLASHHFVNVSEHESQQPTKAEQQSSIQSITEHNGRVRW